MEGFKDLTMSSKEPSAEELRLEYFGKTSIDEALEVRFAISDETDHKLPFNDKTCDTGLFPYRTPDHLEAPIPTPAEIALAKPPTEDHIVKQRKWRVGPYFVKIGYDANLFQEAENIMYLGRNSTVRVPKVYAAFTSDEVDPWQSEDPNDKGHLWYYLVMEYIDGQKIYDIKDEVRPHVPLFEKICELFGEQLRKLRSVPPEDPNHFGRINGRAFPPLDDLRHPAGPSFEDHGPFNYEEMVKKLIYCSKAEQASLNDVFDPIVEHLWRDAEPALMNKTGPNDRIPVLSHMGLMIESARVKLVRDENGKVVDVEEVFLANWEFLCWMPSWYEAAIMYYYGNLPDMIPAYRYLGRGAFERMGHANMAHVAVSGMCAIQDAFYHVGPAH